MPTYRISIGTGAETVRIVESAAPHVTYSSGEQIADFGALPESFSFSVQQVSAVLGPGMPATGVFQ